MQKWHDLDLPGIASQTRFMAPIYLSFDFGADEEKAQHARHQLDTWKQAFRLDKKLLYKLDRGETAEIEDAPAPPKTEKPAASNNTKGKGKSKSGNAKAAATEEEDKEQAASNGTVNLMVRLYFSSHEKLFQQRWLDRIPSEEPFKSAAPKIIRQGDADFDQAQEHFEDLE